MPKLAKPSSSSLQRQMTAHCCLWTGWRLGSCASARPGPGPRCQAGGSAKFRETCVPDGVICWFGGLELPKVLDHIFIDNAPETRLSGTYIQHHIFLFIRPADPESRSDKLLSFVSVRQST